MSYVKWTRPTIPRFYHWDFWYSYNPDAVYHGSRQKNLTYSEVYSWRSAKKATWFYSGVPMQPIHTFRIERFLSVMHHEGVLSTPVSPAHLGRYYNTVGDFLVQYFVQITSFPVQWQLELEPYVLEAQLKAHADLNGPDFPGLTVLAEARETVTNLRETALKGLAICKKAKAQLNALMNVADVKRKPEQAAALWLQYQLEIMPNVSACQELVETLASPKSLDMIRATGAAGVNDKLMGDPIERSGGIQTAICHWQRVSRVTYLAVQKLYATVVRGRKDWGFSSYDALVTTPWELTPLSFVVDYYIDVGTYLQAWRPSDAKVRTGCLTLLRKVTTTQENFWVEIDPRYAYYNSEPELTCRATPYTECFTLERTITASKPRFIQFVSKRLSLIRHTTQAALAILTMGRAVRRGL